MGHFSFSIPPNENFLDLRLFRCGWNQCAPLHSSGPFVCRHFLFHYVISGCGHLDSGGFGRTTQRYELKSGQGFLICPDQEATFCAGEHDPWKYVWLEFGGLRAEYWLNAAGLDISHPVYQPTSPEFTESVRDAMLCITDRPQASTLHLTGLLCHFLDELIRSSANRREAHGTGLPDFYIQAAINYMDRNYQRELTIEEIADVCKLNRSYFSKLFREKMGCPPQEFLIRLRLSKAVELMKHTNASIGDISASCGYPNQFHFSRAFKKRYGIPPREWRLQNQLHNEI